MEFLWPEMLWLVAALPLLVAAYVALLRRRRAGALRYANLGMVREALSARQSVRRHVPALLLLVGLAAMLVALARPAAVITLPAHHETVILAIDVSGSMRAEDVRPNRLAAAQAAAKEFVAVQPASTRIGIVEFSAGAALVQPPTRSREALRHAIDRLEPQNATAIGSAILESLRALFPEGAAVAGAPARPGSHTAAAIILLTDGQNSVGPDAIQSAREAAARGVRVYTVGIGTAHGEIVQAGGWSQRVALDEATLRAVADLTLAEYLHAADAAQLKKVYQALHSRLQLERKPTEITALFSGAAALAVMLAALLSLLWFDRVL